MEETDGHGGTGAQRPRSLAAALSGPERAAALHLVERVRAEVGAVLVQASLFGSKARGQARPDSDIDLLLVFRRLPWDREPQASHAEQIAEQVAEETGVPVTVWSVSLVDLEQGQRTPMLVDALADSIPLWWARRPLPALPFTPADAARCCGALLDRVDEGSEEFERLLREGYRSPAALRLRDDVVRMCIALHLLRGETRPRRAEAAQGLLRRHPSLPPRVRSLLRWAARSYGADGRDEEAPVPPPPGGLLAGARAVEWLRLRVATERERLARGLHPDGT